MSDKPPAYYAKHPCTGCGTGYGFCAQGWTSSMMCCKNCEHPTRWEPDPWTPEDLAEMKEITDGRKDRQLGPGPERQPAVGGSALLRRVLELWGRDR